MKKTPLKELSMPSIAEMEAANILQEMEENEDQRSPSLFIEEEHPMLKEPENKPITLLVDEGEPEALVEGKQL